MTISWTATSPISGRFEPIERVGVDSLIARFEELRARGRGYAEVRGDLEFPVLTLGFTGCVGVIHLMANENETSLLVADSPGPSAAEVLVMDELIEFAPEFVLSLELAWLVVMEFVQTGDAARAGEWCELQ
ncbi:hypothetical protein ACN261_32435 [Micromonospora sp. WMMD723]|uniref:hypothetical protein n=1 Tax=unclassified Micromonospora TaxID=2617518 RepID=UPI003B92EC62